ncbi:MAG: ACT domain-containing protein [Brevinematales bacterium]|nr:ACT domain-containing protein [Brevinematales bacterium]
MIKQVSVFMENKVGRLFHIAKTLGNNKINIRALSLADTSDFGILRLIVDDPDQAIAVLKAESYTVSPTNVMAIEVEDHPGGLSDILGLFDKNGINIEYMYALPKRTGGKAVMIFRFDDDSIEKKLDAAGIKPLRAEDVKTI